MKRKQALHWKLRGAYQEAVIGASAMKVSAGVALLVGVVVLPIVGEKRCILSFWFGCY